MRRVGSSEQGGQKGKVGLCCRGHECDNEKSTLSLLDKGTVLKAGDFVVDAFKPTERISLQGDHSGSRFL